MLVIANVDIFGETSQHFPFVIEAIKPDFFS